MLRRLVIVCALALLWSHAAIAYVVIFKDGSQILTAEAPEVRGDQVILTLPNGTQNSYRASAVDFEKTEEANAGNRLSNARALEGVGLSEIETNTEPEEPTQTLSDLIGSRRGAAAQRPSAQEQEPPPATTPDQQPAADLPRTPAGFIDLQSIERRSARNSDRANAVVAYLKGRNHPDVRSYEGTLPGRLLLEIGATSEASIFKALTDASNALLQIREQHADLDALEILLIADGSRAGQFTLTPELANLLAQERLESPSFFVRYVEF
ncbi:MAG: hypothetical protein AAGN46_06910 [Acidobacteriota bacterium]